MVSGDNVYACTEAFVDELAQAGVEQVCVCPGARSTPLALVIAAHAGLRAWSHIDERCGSFFALGIAKATRKPVALVSTSGTAAANFLPAVVEAFYAHVPMVVLTADRPPEQRDCGAAQTIDQIKLYGSSVKWFAEAGTAEGGVRYFRSLARRAVAAAVATPPGPVHVNFPFREPLMPVAGWGGVERGARTRRPVHEPDRMPSAATVALLEELVAKERRGLLVCGPYDGDERFAHAVSRLSAHAGYPILADPLSQLRTGGHDTRMVVSAFDAMLRVPAFAERMHPGLVLRCGAAPTSKAFLQYLERHADCTQVVVDPLGFWRDPTLLAAEVIRADPILLFEAVAAGLRPVCADPHWCDGWLRADQRVGALLKHYLQDIVELFEGKVFAELAELLPDGAVLYVGNSMPVRDLDAFWPVVPRRIRFLCNRGANGIDGFVSSGLGAAAACDAPLVMVTGDLGLAHDIGGLMAVKRHGVRAVIIVLNNNGAGIFGFLPQAESGSAFEEFFVMPHDLDFRGVVEMYGAAFVRVGTWPEFRAAVKGALGTNRTTVIEVPVDRALNVEQHRKFWAVVAAALEGPLESR